MNGDKPTSCVYRITNVTTGSFYIGSTSMGLATRQYRHLRDLRLKQHHSPYLQRSYNKHGESAFIFEVIEQVDKPEDLLIREQYYIDVLKPDYNVAQIAGGRHFTGRKHRPETLEKMRIAKLGKRASFFTRIAIGLANLGIKRSPETLERMSRAQKGRITSEATKIKQSAAHLGKHHDEETRKKIGDGNRGKFVSQETRIKQSMNQSQFTDEQIMEMRRLAAEGIDLKVIADAAHIERNTAYKIVKGRMYKHLPLVEARA